MIYSLKQTQIKRLISATIDTRDKMRKTNTIELKREESIGKHNRFIFKD
jgi:hypothetical protein